MYCSRLWLEGKGGNIPEQLQRKPIDIVAETSTLEGFTHDVYVNGYRRFSIDIHSLSENGILELVAESIMLGAELLLKDMGKTINDVSDAEH